MSRKGIYFYFFFSFFILSSISNLLLNCCTDLHSANLLALSFPYSLATFEKNKCSRDYSLERFYRKTKNKFPTVDATNM